MFNFTFIYGRNNLVYLFWNLVSSKQRGDRGESTIGIGYLIIFHSSASHCAYIMDPLGVEWYHWWVAKGYQNKFIKALKTWSLLEESSSLRWSFQFISVHFREKRWTFTVGFFINLHHHSFVFVYIVNWNYNSTQAVVLLQGLLQK